MVSGVTTSFSPSQMMKRSGLDRSAFLRLLVTELTYQDPMNPMDNKDFIAQLAQFSTLESVEGMSSGFEKMSQSSQWSYAVSLIGKNVLGVGQDGEDVSGLVTSAKIDDGDIVLSLDNGATIGVNTIKEVQ